LPLTTAQKQEAVVLAAAGYAPSRVAKTMGKSRLMVKRHLEAPETIAMVRDEHAELVELYRQKARDCVAAIDDDKIAKASALQLATSSGILLDKSLLLSGKPTQNVAVIVEVLDVLRKQGDEEIERQHQQAKALLAMHDTSAPLTF
jgi:predicted transcriptional regulator